MQLLDAGIVGSTAVCSLPEQAAPFLSMKPRTLLKFIRVIGRELVSPGLPRTRGGGGLPDETLERVANVVLDWPETFHGLLQERHGVELAAGSDVKPFRSEFSWAFNELGSHLKSDRSELDFVRAELLSFGSRYWTTEQLMRGPARRDLAKLGKSRWGSVADAARAMGIDVRSVMKKIRQGEIPYQESGVHKASRRYRVDMEWIGQFWCYPPRHVTGYSEA